MDKLEISSNTHTLTVNHELIKSSASATYSTRFQDMYHERPEGFDKYSHQFVNKLELATEKLFCDGFFDGALWCGKIAIHRPPKESIRDMYAQAGGDAYGKLKKIEGNGHLADIVNNLFECIFKTGFKEGALYISGMAQEFFTGAQGQRADLL